MSARTRTFILNRQQPVSDPHAIGVAPRLGVLELDAVRPPHAEQWYDDDQDDEEDVQYESRPMFAVKLASRSVLASSVFR